MRAGIDAAGFVVAGARCTWLVRPYREHVGDAAPGSG